MAEIVVRDLDDAVVERLREHASTAGHSLEAEVKLILETEFKRQADMARARELIDKIRTELDGREFPDTVELIREMRDGGR